MKMSWEELTFSALVLSFILGATIGELIRWRDNKQKGKDENG